jgi:hypothetical protein
MVGGDKEGPGASATANTKHEAKEGQMPEENEGQKKVSWWRRLLRLGPPYPSVEESLLRASECQLSIARALSKSINELHKDINKLRSEVSEIDCRVWRLEEHTPEEEMARVKAKVAAYANRAEELMAKYKPDTEAAQS